MEGQERSDKRLTLRPLGFEEALADLLQVEPPPKEPPRDQAQRDKAQTASEREKTTKD